MPSFLQQAVCGECVSVLVDGEDDVKGQPQQAVPTCSVLLHSGGLTWHFTIHVLRSHS